MLGFTPVVYAQTVQDLHNYQDLVEQQKQIVQKQQEQIKAITKPAQERLDALRRNVKVTTEQIQDNEQKLKVAQTSLQKLEKKLQELEYDLNRKRSATTARLRYLQKQQMQKWWVLLLSSQNLNQFADRHRQLNRIYEGDRQLLITLKQNTDRVESQRSQVTTQANEIALLTQKLKYQKANFEAEAVAQANVIDRLKSDRRALELAEDRLVQDSQQITRLILAKAQTAPGILIMPGTGQLMYPTVGEVTSPFGWRMHPILGYERFHSGIDFGADYGSMVYASDRGTVIYAGWYGGYGNAVIIDHGNGLTTLYGHCSELFVNEGQVVQKGQPISAVGSTGFSTGPHLHFEVRANGEPVDPAQFL
ncbi:peptidoglycan DD-metalloendopeptidase family protein [Tumidithrix elongata RA019]|uniref:Peptidoglycan DD-metalloendopeptidase family protein n=1 Tax=Tumidithrix elongata BACA0141 TaxID=2716417 RepID=A0AAW9PVK4_9CYAN|nr:peptidoglycan DD-metalloendopeptidase family protein [Tumidithrix elongata RA019]